MAGKRVFNTINTCFSGFLTNFRLSFMRAATIILLFCICFTLCSCPYTSSYKMDETPSIYVEDLLLGGWATFIKKPGSGKEEPVKLILSKRSDTEYDIIFTGYLSELKPFNLLTEDSIKGTAFMSTACGKQFLNINIKSRIYLAELKFENGSLSLLPLVEHFTTKMVQSNTALRSCVEFHYKTHLRPMYDDDFCLKDMVRVK